MIKVKFFGLLRMDLKCEGLECKADTVADLLTEIAAHLPQITVAELKDCLIFVGDDNIANLKLFKTKLKDGDVVHLMHPVSGG
jgi:molybdopterin converting factor small subunit